MDGENEYTVALNRFDELSRIRNDPSFWSDNLIQATKNLKNPMAWRNFYAVLGNSDHVYSDEKGIRTLDDFIRDHDGVVDPKDESPIQFDETRVYNGSVTHIRLTPKIEEYIEKHNGKEIEPLDLVSEGVEEEKQW